MSIISKITTTNGVTHDVIDSKYYAGENVYIGELVPDGYTPVEWICNAQEHTYIRTEIAPDVDDYEIRLKFTAVNGESPLFINRRNNNGIGGGDGKICLYCSGQEVDCGLARIEGNIYETVAKVKNGDYTFRVTNLTTSATNTVSGSYRYSSDTNPFYLFSNSSDYAKPECRIWYLQFFKAGKCELNYIPLENSNPRGSYRFWDVVSQKTVNATSGLLGGGDAIDRRFDHYVSVPDYPVVGKLNTNNSTAQEVNSSESFSGTVKLHKISKTGSYSDLSNKPTIPSAANDAPLMDGDAAVGTSTDYAREDHVHPSDTNKQNKLIAGKDIEIQDIVEVEYLESSGTQYIDTGFTPNQDSRVQLDVLIPSLSAGACSFGGSQNGAWTPGFSVYGGNSSYLMASVYNNSDDTASSSYKFQSNNRYILDLNKNTYTVYKNSAEVYSYSHPTGDFQLVHSIELFRLNLSTPRYGKFRLYSAIISNDGVLTHDLIPVRCGTTGYMYDRMSGMLFGNNGTGNFIVGQDVGPISLSLINFVNNDGFALDSNVVHINSDETVTGQKTFSVPVKLVGGAQLFDSSTSTSDYIQLYKDTNDTSTGSAKSVVGLLGPIGAGDVIIRGVDTPIEDYDAATKGYVDSVAGGGGGGDAGNSKLFYGFCSTVAATTAKVVSCTGFTSADLVHGVMVLVEFDATNSGAVASLTLNVASTGAYPIKKIYSTSIDNLTSAGELRAGSIIPFVFTGNYWMVTGVDYNSNDLAYRVRLSEGAVLPTLDKFYRYRLLFTSADGQGLVPANTSTSTNATAARTPNTRKIDPFGSIFYYSTTSAVNAGASPSSSYVWYCNNMTLGYSFNNTGAALTLTPNKPVYVVCNPQTDGSAIIDATTPYTQELPSTEDGKIYIYLGITYSATAMMLAPYHPVYEYKAGCVRLYSSSDSNVVHKTGDETVGGTKTFSNNVVLGTNSNLHLLTAQDDGVYVEAGEGGGVKTLMFAGISDDSEVKLENVATPTFGTDAANKNYVDKESGSVTFNGYSNQYGIQPKSLCAFSASAGGATMYMTSFTTGGGTGNKVPASNLVFPIGCKIYYYDESEAFASMTAFTNKKFYSSFNGVDGRYSAITGYHLSLSSSSTSNVYMRVMVGSTLGYWSPFYKAGTTTEIFVTSDNLVSGEFYIHLGKTIGTNGVMFQLEDNNPLYYYDATNGLTDWATYVAKTYGGSSYVAGQGISISGNTISAETPEVTITDTGNVTATIEPNTVYSFSDPLTSLSVTLDDSPSGLRLYHFFVKNSDFSNPLTMTINCSNYVFEPSHIVDSVSFTLNPRMSYEFSILLRGFTAYVKKSSFGLP